MSQQIKKVSAMHSLIGRLGAFVTHSRYEGRDITAKARTAFLTRFTDQVDPNRVLSDEERKKRARMALKAHMTGLAIRSAQARSAKRNAAEP